MTISKAQIFNITLNILGISNPLENANSSDNRAILLNNYYELARDYVLKDFDWNFASAYRELTLSDKTVLNSSYLYCYDYPNECICARDIFQKGDFKKQKFTIASAENGASVILCNVDEAVLRYTRRVYKEVYFTCEFAMALSYYLASLTSCVICGGVQKGELAYEKYTKILKRAKVINASEDGENLYNESTYLDSRG